MNFRGYRDTLKFQRRGTPDAFNEAGAWIDVVTQRGAIEPLRGRQMIAAQGIFAETTVRIRTRYNASITSDMRAVDAFGTAYSIGFVVDMANMHREFELLCTTGVRDA